MENYKQQFYVRELRRTNNRRIAILGNGLVSYITSKLFHNSVILTKTKNDLFLGNIFFHDTIENRMLMHLSNTRFQSVEIPVYYHDYQTRQVTRNPTVDIKRLIVKEKMGYVPKEDKIILSTINEDNVFRCLKIDEFNLKQQLISSSDALVELYPDRIVEHADHVEMKFGNDTLEFDYVINTIPQPFFTRLVHEYDKYEYSPITFVSFQTTLPDSMTYYYNNSPYVRSFIKDGLCTFEFNHGNVCDAHIILEEFLEQLPPQALKQQELPYGRIISLPAVDTNRIKHLGRFAQWDHSITTEHVINKLLKLNIQ